MLRLTSQGATPGGSGTAPGRHAVSSSGLALGFLGARTFFAERAEEELAPARASAAAVIAERPPMAEAMLPLTMLGRPGVAASASLTASQ
jgi:hypothetical protein